MRVLVLSAYDAVSHRYWREALQEMFPDWSWQHLTLPPRHFSWRVRGNPLHWALAERELLEARYDLLIATSMVDLATLRGLVPALAALPSVLYFHENQFAYPQTRQRHALVEAQMVSLYAALAADTLVFNSNYNRATFFAGLGTLLQRLPDKVPRGVDARLRDKSLVLPVPLRSAAQSDVATCWPQRRAGTVSSPLRLLWLGRFEHDKGGESLLCTLRELERCGLDYELALVGQQFRESPAAFATIADQFTHRLVQFGYLPQRQDYLGWLAGADLVLSTALHEFQGIAVLEAVRAACLPVVPDRLAYPEIFEPRWCYPSAPERPAEEGAGAATLIIELAEALAGGEVRAPDIDRFALEQLRPEYARVLLASCRARGGSAADSQ